MGSPDVWLQKAAVKALLDWVPWVWRHRAFCSTHVSRGWLDPTNVWSALDSFRSVAILRGVSEAYRVVIDGQMAQRLQKIEPMVSSATVRQQQRHSNLLRRSTLPGRKSPLGKDISTQNWKVLSNFTVIEAKPINSCIGQQNGEDSEGFHIPFLDLVSHRSRCMSLSTLCSSENSKISLQKGRC